MNQLWGTAAAVTHEYWTRNVNTLKGGKKKAGKQHSLCLKAELRLTLGI